MGKPLVVLVLLLTVGVPASGPSAQHSAAAGPDRFTVMSDGHPLAVWARRPEAPTHIAVLVHGRTWSSLPDFDLQVPDLPRSVMSALAARGIAAYAVDLRGYGQTPRDETGWLTPRRSAQDVANVAAWVARRHPALPAPALVGWSRGAAIAQLAAQSMRGGVSGLVLFGFAYEPGVSFIDAASSARPLRLRNTAESAAADFISPEITPQTVIDAFVAQALAADPTLADLRNDSEFNALRPGQLTLPTLVLFGSEDPSLSEEDARKMFASLGSRDKRFVVLPGAGHAAQLEDTHDAWVEAVAGFILTRQ